MYGINKNGKTTIGDLMKINSIWSDVELPKYPTLTENKKVKYLIIGGGMTGINCLYHLRNEDVILVEQNNLASGVTKNTTGKLTYLQDSLYEKIINQTNEDYARQYLLSQLAAIRLAKKIIKDNNIECDLVKTKSFLFTTTEKDIQKIKQTKKFLEDNHIVVGENHMKEVSNLYSIDVSDTYIFHPLKYIAGLLKTIDSSKIFENTKITKIKKENDYYICYTKQGTIEASKVILATNYPYFIYPYFFPFKCYLEKSYCLAYPKKETQFP